MSKLDPETLSRVVRRAQNGDADAMSTLAQTFLRAAFAVALAVVHRKDDAEDIAQDAFVIALEKIETCRDPTRFRSWLLQIVRNRAINHIAQRRLRDPVEGKESAANDTQEPDLQQRLINSLQALTPIQREVILLHDLQEWTHAEIGESLDISEVMSRQHLFLARKAMRARLDPGEPS